MSSSRANTLVIIPTYNEAQNLTGIVTRVRSAEPTVDILIVDDASPDGTGLLADHFAYRDGHVHSLHRPGKYGLGGAYRAGFAWALERGYELVVQLDADGSHQPEQLRRLLAAAGAADLVIGSRWIPGGSVRNWPRHRLVLSRTANWYVRHALAMTVRDATAGYRVYRADTLRAIDLGTVRSEGYCFQIELTHRTSRADRRIAEVPIDFVERTHGRSKMSSRIILEALLRVTGWSLTRRRTPVGRSTRPPFIPPPFTSAGRGSTPVHVAHRAVG